MNNRPIGVFDSGVGGLTVLKRLEEAMPNENYIYFGDTARVPYGEKTPERLIDFSYEILNWFSDHNVKAVVMACNTSSAITLDIVKDRYAFPVFGLIEPVVEYISGLDILKLGVLATSATINSNAYKNAINKKVSNIEVYQVACPGLVEIVESGNIDTPESKKIINSYIEPLIKNDVHQIVLGCTHYPYLTDTINKILKAKDKDILIDPALHLVKQVKATLESDGLMNKQNLKGEKAYYVSASPQNFVKAGCNFYSDCTNAHLIDVCCLNK